MSNLPIQFIDKENSPALLAFMQQFGEQSYVDAELINKFRDAINEIHSSLNPDRIISLGTETISGNQRTYEGYKWQINGVEINNIGNPIQLIFPSATTGFKRNDISVFKADGTIERIAGIETDGEIVSPPDVPEGTLYFKTYSIDGNVVESEPEPPIIDGSIYKKKIENTRYKSRLSGENVIIPFQAAGQSHYSVTRAALVSVAGFTTAGLTTPMYEGQDVIFENQTGHDITLKDSFGVDTSFVIGDDLVVPYEGKIWFRFRNNKLELIDKNWFGIQEVVTPQNLGEFIDGLDSKTDIKDDDEFIISDSEDSLKSKKTRFLDLKTKLKSYFDTFYLSLSVFDIFAEAVFDSLDGKLDKSSTASSVYGTDASGDQTMIPVSEFKGVIEGYKGIATQANAPTPYSESTHPNGLFERYIVNTPITSPNSWGNIVVTEADLDVVNGVANNRVILEVNNGVVTKRVERVKGDAGSGVTEDYVNDVALLNREVPSLRNGFVAPDGTVNTAYGGAHITDYTPLDNVYQLISGKPWSGQYSFAFFNENKVFISGTDVQNLYKSDFPAGARFYIYICENPYLPCTEYYKVIPATIADVKSELQSYAELEFKELPHYQGFIELNGNINYANIGRRTDFNRVEVGTKIIYKGAVTNSSLSIAGYGENKEFVSSLLQAQTYADSVTVTIANPDIKYIIASGINGMGEFKVLISQSISLVEETLISELSPNLDIVALDRYDIAQGKKATLYKNQFKIAEDVMLNVWGGTTIDGIYAAKEAIISFQSQPIPNTTTQMSFEYWKNNNIIKSKLVNFRIVPSGGGDGRKINIIVSGDSLVDGRPTAPEMFRLLNLDGDYVFNPIGMYPVDMDGVTYKEEGRGAWSWESYLNPVGETTGLYGNVNYFMKNGVTNFANYLTQNFPSEDKIDIFIMLLGTNDVNQGSGKMNDQQLNAVIVRAKTFIDAFLSANPNGVFLVGLSSIGGDFPGQGQNVANFRKNIQRLNLLYIQHFDKSAYHPRVRCVHHGAFANTELAYNSAVQQLDVYLPGKETNIFYDAIHPLENGYKQFGRGLYNAVRGVLKDFFQ